MSSKALQKTPPKSTYTPVFYAGPSASFSTVTTAQTKSSPRKKNTYIDQLSLTHLAMAQLVAEAPPSQPSSHGSSREGDENHEDGKQGDIEKGTGTNPGAAAIREEVKEAYQAAGGDPADGRWTFLSQRLQMGVTRGGFKWIGTRTDGTIPQPGKGFINAETEEEWLDWEERRRAEDELRDKVERWQKNIRNTEKAQKSTGMHLSADEGQNSKTVAQSKGDSKAVKSQPTPPAPVKTSAPQNPTGPSPLGFSVVKRFTVSLSAKPKSKSSPRLADKNSKDQELPPPQRLQPTREPHDNLQAALPQNGRKAVPISEKHIGDISETIFFPPSFPAQLVTSTPNAQHKNRFKPSPILFPALSSPLTPHTPTRPQSAGRDIFTHDAGTSMKTNKRRRSVSRGAANGATKKAKPGAAHDAEGILVPSSSAPTVPPVNPTAMAPMLAKDSRAATTTSSRRVTRSMKADEAGGSSTMPKIVDLSLLSPSRLTKKRNARPSTGVNQAAGTSSKSKPRSTVAAKTSSVNYVNSSSSLKGKRKETEKEAEQEKGKGRGRSRSRGRSAAPNNRKASRSHSRPRNTKATAGATKPKAVRPAMGRRPVTRSQSRTRGRMSNELGSTPVPPSSSYEQETAQSPLDVIPTITSKPLPVFTLTPVPTPDTSHVDEPLLPVPIQAVGDADADPHLMEGPYEHHTDVNLTLDRVGDIENHHQDFEYAHDGANYNDDFGDGGSADNDAEEIQPIHHPLYTYVDYYTPTHTDDGTSEHNRDFGLGMNITVPKAPPSLSSLAEDSDEEGETPGSDPSGVYDDIDDSEDEEDEDIEVDSEGDERHHEKVRRQMQATSSGERGAKDLDIDLPSSEAEVLDEIIDVGVSREEALVEFTGNLDDFDPPFASTQVNGTNQGRFVGRMGKEGLGSSSLRGRQMNSKAVGSIGPTAAQTKPSDLEVEGSRRPRSRSRSRSRARKGLEPGSSGMWMGYNSQFDVNGQIEKVSKLLEEDVDIYGFGQMETIGSRTSGNGRAGIDSDVTDEIENIDED